jgi:hypothetical protein
MPKYRSLTGESSDAEAAEILLEGETVVEVFAHPARDSQNTTKTNISPKAFAFNF